MGTGYTRADTANNIADGNIINANDLDGEFDAIEAAFATTGHTHDGTAAEGGAILVLGPTQEFVVSSTEAKPSSNAGLSLGTDLLQFNNLYIDGKAYIDGLGESMLVDTTSKIQFRDVDLFINSSADGQLDIEADTTIELTAPTVSLTNDLKLKSDASVLYFGADDDVSVTHVADVGLKMKSSSGLSLALQTSDTTIESGNRIGRITFNAPDEASGTDAIVTGASIEAIAEATFDSTTNSTALVFKTNTSGAAAERMRLTSDGNLRFLDNRKATFGGADDLQIYHDGQHSYVTDQGTGRLYLQGTANITLTNADATAEYANFANGGAVSLRYDNLVKFATTSTGVNVTGTIGNDTNTDTILDARPSAVSGNRRGIIIGRNFDTPNRQIEFGYTSDAYGQFPGFYIEAGGSKDRFVINSNGDVAFYNAAGTAAGFWWDATDERLGIGNTSPAYPLHVQTSSGIVAHLVTTSHGSDAELNFTAENASGTAKSGQVFFDPDENTIGFKNGGNKRIRIDSAGVMGQRVVPESTWNTTSAVIQQGYSSALWSGTTSNYVYLSSNTIYTGTDFEYIYSAPASFYLQDNSGNHIFKTAPSGTAGDVTTFVEAMRISNNGNVTVNDGGEDQDFRVESDSSTHMLFVDALNNRVGINDSGPVSALTVNGDILSNWGNSGEQKIGIAGRNSNVFSSSEKTLIITGADAAAGSQAMAGGDVIVRGGVGAGNEGLNIYAGHLYLEGGLHTGGVGTEGGAGKIYMKTAGYERLNINQYGGVIINEVGDDADFRVESANNTNMLLINAGDDHVAIGGNLASSNANLTINANDTAVYDPNTLDTGGGLSIYKHTSTQTNGDSVGLVFRVTTNNGSSNALGAIRYVQPTYNTFAGRMMFQTRNFNGTYYEQMRLDSQSGALFNAEGENFLDFAINASGNAPFFKLDAGNSKLRVGSYQNDDGNTMTVGLSGSQTYTSGTAEGQLGISTVNNANGNNQHAGLFFRVSSNNGSNNANASIGLKQPTYTSHNSQLYFNLRSQTQNKFQQYGLIDSETGWIFNDNAQTYMDFRVESANKSHALFVDSSADRVQVAGHFSLDENGGGITAYRSNQFITGEGTSSTSGAWFKIMNSGYTAALDVHIIAYGGTPSQVGVWTGKVAIAYGGGVVGLVAERYQGGNITDIEVRYNNTGQDLEMRVTYTGTTPTVYWTVNGASNIVMSNII